MQNLAEFTEKQPDYRYFKVNDERADIFIYKFIEEIDSNGIGGGSISFDEEGNVINVEVNEDNHVYSYKVNCFTVDPNEITEEMIKENPLDYIDYVKPTEEVEQVIRRIFYFTIEYLKILVFIGGNYYGTHNYLQNVIKNYY